MDAGEAAAAAAVGLTPEQVRAKLALLVQELAGGGRK